MLPPERIWILTNDYLRDEIVRQLPEVPKTQILAEPAQRNTAPAIGLAAHILQGLDPDAIMGVFPADHVILKPSRYIRMVKAAFRAAAAGRIVVLGIQPRWAETGYGYVEFPEGVEAGSPVMSPVLSFREKPDEATAGQFSLPSGFAGTPACSFGRPLFCWRSCAVTFLKRRRLSTRSRRFEAGSSNRSLPSSSRSQKTSPSITPCWRRPKTSAGL